VRNDIWIGSGSYICILQKFDTEVGKRIQDLKQYSAEKFNSEFSTQWFQIMPDDDDQILRAKTSTQTDMSLHDYLHRKTANRLLIIIVNKERGGILATRL
jgi:hypothetical protein